jgi:hypothetical protein
VTRARVYYPLLRREPESFAQSDHADAFEHLVTEVLQSKPKGVEFFRHAANVAPVAVAA